MVDAKMDEKTAMRFSLMKAFALQAAQIEANPWCAVERVSDGYIAQEMHRRNAERGTRNAEQK